MILDKIVTAKRIKLGKQILQTPQDKLIEKTNSLPEMQSGQFKDALKKPGLSIIAEVKKASPSKGIICENFCPVSIAQQYEKYGADAISVLTEEDFFAGSNEYLTSIRKAVLTPLLRKDFIIDIWQVYESRCIGANAILLIAAILTEKQLTQLREKADELGMCALVETHNEQEMSKAIASGAEIIGINNRNLKTFEVSLKTTQRLIKMIPSGKVIVSESGIINARDAKFVAEHGVDAVLVGESLMRADNIEEQLCAIKRAGDSHG